MGFLDRFLKPTPDRFAARMIQRLRAAGLDEELQYERATFRILRFKDGAKVGECNLGNMYQVYLRQAPRDRARCLTQCVRSALTTARELPSSFENARSDITLKLWSRAVLENMRMRSILEGNPNIPSDLPFELVGDHLIVVPCYDWPESTQTLDRDTLSDWDVSVYEALEVGRANLEETLSEYARLGESLYVVSTGDSYDAARLTLIDRLRDLEVTGQHVAMVPNRDHLIVTGSDDELGLQIMADLAEKGLGEAYPLSAIPLILDSDGWRDWMPAEAHPLHQRFRDMEVHWIGRLYAEQKELMDAVHEKEETDLYVGVYNAVQRKTGELVSYCVWGEGVDALLPVAHNVFIMRAGHSQPVAMGSWDRVRAVAGALMEPTDDYPPRFRVREIPDEAALDAIGLAEL